MNLVLYLLGEKEISMDDWFDNYSNNVKDDIYQQEFFILQNFSGTYLGYTNQTL